MQIHLATSNANKRREIEDQLAAYPALQGQVNFKTLKDVSSSVRAKYDPVESGSTFLQNAEIKARDLYNLILAPVVSEDSGIEVFALGNRPGVHSARYAPSDEERNTKLLNEMKGVLPEERGARFVTSLCFLDENGNALFFNGRAEGYITQEPRGNQGFGFDPIFFYRPLNCTFGEIPPEKKREVSHRGQAVAKFLNYLDKWLNTHAASQAGA